MDMCNICSCVDRKPENTHTFTNIKEKIVLIDSLMRDALENIRIPGMAVGIVGDGVIAFTTGCGF